MGNPFEIVREREVITRIREVQRVEVEKIRRTKKLKTEAEKIVDRIMEEFDIDKSGKLEKQEAREFIKSMIKERNEE